MNGSDVAADPALKVLEERRKQVHEYTRHTFQVLVTWFTFFCTVNYIAMGWFASKSSAGAGAPSASGIFLVASMFVTQNVLGLIAILVVRGQLLAAAPQVEHLDRLLGCVQHGDSPSGSGCVPVRTYRVTTALMGLALLPLAAGWCMLPFLGSS